MPKGTGSETYVAALNLLIDQRDKLIHELEQCDHHIAGLKALVGSSGMDIPTSKANQYRGVKKYDAALDYMQEKRLEEISLSGLRNALVERGLYMGKHAEREIANLSIAITQNNNHGRNELVIRDGKVARNLVR